MKVAKRCQQPTGAVVERHACGSPDKGDDAFCHHGSVEYLAAVLFIGKTPCHQRRLCCMEAGDGAAGNGDKHGGPYRSA